jgi:hypothetical protein
VINSTFSGNRANGFHVQGFSRGFGGGIYSSGVPLTVTNSTFTGNFAYGDGGGIEFINAGGTLTITNSTFTDNIADVPSDSGDEFGSGGAVANHGTLTITNSTFTGNRAGAGGGFFSSVPAVLRNTILTGVPRGNCASSITDGGHNLDDGASCGFSTANGSLSNTDPQLDPAGLRDNGGPTQTVALCVGAGVPAGCLAASPAIDAGDSDTCAAAPVSNRDQRGLVRPGIGHTQSQCSMGAYEADVPALACTGDCNTSDDVTIDEIIQGVDIALGNATLDQCQAFDCNGNGHVTVDCIIGAVNTALFGCPCFASGCR